MIYRFGAHAVDTGSLALTRDGAEIAVEPQVFWLLQLLIENRERVVSKDEIIAAVWDGRIVSDGTLNTRINSVRRAVGDDGKAQTVIKTFARRGFRFVADLADEAAIAAELLLPGGGSDKPAIAVLPFGNLSGDPEQEYFSDGLAEDIISALSRFRQLAVVSRNSSFAYRGAGTDTRDVARELGAGYVLEGSVRKSGNRVRISVQLIDGASGNQIWSERYDRDLEDIFAVQDEITEAVAGAVEPELTKSEIARARAKRPESLSAWERYLQGIFYISRRSSEDITEAIRCLEEAIALAPEFSPAYQGLSHAKLMGVVIGITHKEEVADETVALARRALSLDRDDDRAHIALGRALFFSNRYDEALPVIEEAMRLNPTSAFSHYLAGRTLIRLGRAEEGLKFAEEALRLSPRDLWIGPFIVALAEAHLLLGNFETVIELCDRALREANATWIPATLRVVAFAKLNRTKDVELAAEELLARFSQRDNGIC